MKLINPKEFYLPARTLLEQMDKQSIAIVVNRKSRIIMADGKKILEKALKIQEVQPSVKIVLKTTAPVCSKTVHFLESENIQVITK